MSGPRIICLDQEILPLLIRVSDTYQECFHGFTCCRGVDLFQLSFKSFVRRVCFEHIPELFAVFIEEWQTEQMSAGEILLDVSLNVRLSWIYLNIYPNRLFDA